MYLAYSLLLTLGLLVLIPHFLFQALVHGKYVPGLRQRLGSLPFTKDPRKKVIWLHCVSVGETQAARPLVERLHKEFPQYSLVVSTITTTGQNLARQVFGDYADEVFYFPFDWRWSVRRSLKKINPDVVLIMETELWPNFLRECRSRTIPVALVNGRISRQSFRRYRLVRFFLAQVLKNLTLGVMQSSADAERIAELGLSEARILTSGNLKFDANSLAPAAQITEAIDRRFAVRQGPPVILAASTHAPEEKIAIESFLELRQKQQVRLMIAPRKPERFQEVAQLLAESGLTWVRKTDSEQPGDQSVDAILLDTIGELTAVYSLATVVFVGGSIVDHGGQNVLEPAAAGTCVITGHHTHNFHAIIQLLNEADAIVQLPPLDPADASQCLTHELGKLLADVNRRHELARRAKEIVQNNQGATDRTIAMIKPLITQSATDEKQHPEFVVSPSSGS
jgi:3-deoxy-D-manno-octulosonic-acid transferase